MEESLEETLSFAHRVLLSYSDLNESLEQTIHTKLMDIPFVGTDYDVIDVISFTVNEMLIAQNNVIDCKITLTVRVNKPRVGKVITVSEYDVKGNNIVYRNGNIQLIAKKTSDKDVYKIRIQSIKLLSKYILCAGEIVE